MAVPALLLRRKIIVDRLTECNAFSEENAVTMQAAGVFNPNGFKRFNRFLVYKGILGVTSDGRYYLKQPV
ncbi:MAG: hypothetical protein J1F04_09875 [Oscillospiraceae bacterium]|nr:hypothetical protein [Oscillospiraceae bacterium]